MARDQVRKSDSEHLERRPPGRPERGHLEVQVAQIRTGLKAAIGAVVLGTAWQVSTRSSTSATFIASARPLAPESDPTSRKCGVHQSPASATQAAMSSAKSSWIGARGGHWMLGQDRCAGKRLEECDMPSNVNPEIDGDRPGVDGRTPQPAVG